MSATPAPEFPPGIDWLNTTEPLRMAKLPGRVMALDLGNAGSAVASTILADLVYRRNRHPDRLNVVAVSVPRFDHEREPRRVASGWRAAVSNSRSATTPTGRSGSSTASKPGRRSC